MRQGLPFPHWPHTPQAELLRAKHYELTVIGHSFHGQLRPKEAYYYYGREPRLPVDAKILPPAADDLSTSVLNHRKRIVEKAEFAQNFAGENMQRSQQKIKEYYVRNASQPLFEIEQCV